MMIGRLSILDTDGEAPPRHGPALIYVGGAVVASLFGSLFALATRLELLGPAQTIMGADPFRQLSLLRDLIFTFGVALPSVAGLGHLLSAPGTTLPVKRLETLALGGFVLSAFIMLAGSAVTGWFFLLLATGACMVAAAAALLQAVAFILRGRQAPPQRQRSLFAQALHVACVVEIVTLPIAAGLCAALMTERLAGETLWHGAGADPALLEHWLRLLVTPLGAIALLPAIGVVSDALETAAQRRLVGRRAVAASVWALALLGVVSALARLHSDEPVMLAVSSFFALAMTVPFTLILGNWIVTLLTAPRQSSPERWFAIAALVSLAELALTGAPLALLDRGPRLDGTVFQQGHSELVWATIGFAVAAALCRAWPKLTGARPVTTWLGVACLLGCAGVQLATLAQLGAGARGMSRGYAYPPEFHRWAVAASAGSLLWMAAAAMIAVSLMVAVRRAVTRVQQVH
jgi:cytochrome aa3-600 menaquinol oxidase subunit 1